LLTKTLANFFQDYVRAGCVSQISSDVVVSGSYDHTVRIWDRRQESSNLQINHGSPVESVLLMPSGTLLVTAGLPRKKNENFDFSFLTFFL
jgi:U3 small nucleolar RNA-associated protein 15